MGCKSSEIYDRIRKYVSKTDTAGFRMRANELQAIDDCSRGVYDAICLAFRFGFEKGCRKTRKMMNT